MLSSCEKGNRPAAESCAGHSWYGNCLSPAVRDSEYQIFENLGYLESFSNEDGLTAMCAVRRILIGYREPGPPQTQMFARQKPRHGRQITILRSQDESTPDLGSPRNGPPTEAEQGSHLMGLPFLL